MTAIDCYIEESPILTARSQLMELALRDYLGLDYDIKKVTADRRTLKGQLEAAGKLEMVKEKVEEDARNFEKTKELALEHKLAELKEQVLKEAWRSYLVCENNSTQFISDTWTTDRPLRLGIPQIPKFEIDEYILARDKERKK